MTVFDRDDGGNQIHECAPFRKEMARRDAQAAPLVTQIVFSMTECAPILTNKADVSVVSYCPFCGTDLRDNE